MKKTQSAFPSGLLLLAGALSLHAASGTWTGVTDNTWAGLNWSASPVPGAADTATFSGAGNGNTTIDLGSGVSILNLIFNAGNTAAYSIGNGAAGSQTLTLANAGSITVNSTVVSNELFNAAIVLGTDKTAQTYTIANNSSNTLTFAGNLDGGLTGGTAGTKTLSVRGLGNTVISGSITNGGATTVAITKSGSGNLTFNGTVNAQPDWAGRVPLARWRSMAATWYWTSLISVRLETAICSTAIRRFLWAAARSRSMVMPCMRARRTSPTARASRPTRGLT